jgi:hypothetical protein
MLTTDKPGWYVQYIGDWYEEQSETTHNHVGHKEDEGKSNSVSKIAWTRRVYKNAAQIPGVREDKLEI